MMKDKFKKTYTENQILKKAEDYCAYQERCQQEVRNKLYTWNLKGREVESIIALLISEGFINEERFAKAFAGGKFRIKKWGKTKIKNELIKRNISEYCIRKGLEEIDDLDYFKNLDNIIKKKLIEFKGFNKFTAFNKAAAYAISKGYEPEMVWNIVKNISE